MANEAQGADVVGQGLPGLGQDWAEEEGLEEG